MRLRSFHTATISSQPIVVAETIVSPAYAANVTPSPETRQCCMSVRAVASPQVVLGHVHGCGQRNHGVAVDHALDGCVEGVAVGEARARRAHEVHPAGWKQLQLVGDRRGGGEPVPNARGEAVQRVAVGQEYLCELGRDRTRAKSQLSGAW